MNTAARALSALILAALFALPARAQQPVAPQVSQAETLMTQGKLARALSVLTAYLKHSGGDARALVDRARVQAALGKPAAAVADFNAALAIDPSMERAQLATCVLLYQLQRLDDSIAACSKAITLEPNDTDAYDQRALSLDAKDDTGHEALAVNDVTKSITLKPDNAWAYSERCELRIELAQYDAATPDCDRSLALDASNGWTWYQRGRIAMHAKDFAGAQNYFQKSLENKFSVKYARVELAEAQNEAGNSQEALKNVNAYLAQYPSVSAAHLVRAKIYMKMNQRQDALVEAKQALALAKIPDDKTAAQAIIDELTH